MLLFDSSPALPEGSSKSKSAKSQESSSVPLSSSRNANVYERRCFITAGHKHQIVSLLPLSAFFLTIIWPFKPVSTQRRWCTLPLALVNLKCVIFPVYFRPILVSAGTRVGQPNEMWLLQRIYRRSDSLQDRPWRKKGTRREGDRRTRFPFARLGKDWMNLAIDLATNSSLTPKWVSGLLGVRFRLSGGRSGLVDK